MRIAAYSQRRKARIEIIPLIDIIFFLLATFVMVSLSMVRDKGISVNLPQAESGTAQGTADYIAITLEQDGSLFVNKERVAPNELEGRITALLQSLPDPKVVINGDEAASLGRAIEILDQVRKLGITKVAVRTRTTS